MIFLKHLAFCLRCIESSSEHKWSSSIVYHRLIYSTQSVGAMFWLMAQLRRGQLRMVVDVVGSCWWCGQLSVQARHTHMLHCPPVPTSSWKLCIARPQFAVCLGSSSVFDSVLLPWRLLLGPIGSGVLGWVRMLPTPVAAIHASFDRSSGINVLLYTACRSHMCHCSESNTRWNIR